MPFYPMQCKKCSYAAEVYRSIVQGAPESCPECGATEAEGFTQKWDKLNTRTWVYGQDRITTVGQQAEYNEKKSGKELTAKAFERTKTVKEEACPWAQLDGVKVGKPVESKKPWWRDGSVEGLPEKDKPVDATKLDTPEKVEKYIMEGKT